MWNAPISFESAVCQLPKQKVLFVHYTGQDEAQLQGISCTDAASISFSISIPDFAEWEGSADERAWRLNDIDGCEPTFDDVNGFVTYSGVNVALCDPGDPSTTADGSKFEYEFVISVDAEAGSTTDYVVKCFYNREQENIMASFQPRHSLTDSGSGKLKSINLNNNELPLWYSSFPLGWFPLSRRLKLTNRQQF